MGWGRGRFGFSINYILISSPSPQSRRLQNRASRTPRPHDERQNTIPQQLPPAGAYPPTPPAATEQRTWSIRGQYAKGGCFTLIFDKHGRENFPIWQQVRRNPWSDVERGAGFHCYWTSLRFSRKHNSAKNIVRKPCFDLGNMS